MTKISEREARHVTGGSFWKKITSWVKNWLAGHHTVNYTIKF